MKLSIITVVRNHALYIEDCIKSVLAQSYGNVEYIIIDGRSTDGTLDIIKRYKDRISGIVSEVDSCYADAMNKGLKMASGDIVGFLNADDFYANNSVLAKVAQAFDKNGTDIIYGDVVYVRRDDKKSIVRYWRASSYDVKDIKYGWMPPHPAFFARRETYKKFGPLNSDFRIAADYELVLRLLYRYGICASYLPEILVNMRCGGRSNRWGANIVKKIVEDYRACRMHGLGFSTVVIKNIRKLPQFFLRRVNI